MAGFICPSCAREHPEDARVCTACGTALTLAVCAACEAINAIDAVDCHQCGARLVHGVESVDAAPAPWSGVDAAPAPWSGADAAPAPQGDDVSEPPTEARFVLDTVEDAMAAHPDADDDVIALGEKRYVGPDARQHALADATPIAFAERVGDELSFAEAPSFGHDATSGMGSRRRRAAHRARAGVALALVIVAGVSGYRAFDVPAVRDVIATTLARANAIVPRGTSPTAPPSIEHADNARPRSPSTASQASSPSVHESAPVMPAIETVTAPSPPPARASSDAPPNEAMTVRSAQTTQATPGVSTKAREADAQRGSIARTHSQPSRHAPDRDALETQRLIERDLGRFLAK